MKPDEKRSGTKNLVAQYPTHIPMGLPLPDKEEDDRDEKEYSL